MLLMFGGNKWKIYVFVLILLLILITVWATLVLSKNTFYTGISVDGIKISGLDRDMAELLLEKKTGEKYNNEKIKLVYGDKKWNLDFCDISLVYLTGLALEKAYKNGREGNVFKRLYDIIMLNFKNINIKSELNFDYKKLKTCLADIKNQIDREEKNASIIFNKGAIAVNREAKGKILDIDKNVNLIENHLLEGNFSTIELYVEEKIPGIVFDDIKGINCVISYFSTIFNQQDINRSYNIKLACDKINGIIVLPGEIFSMNKALGPRTIEYGFKEAPVIYKNELVKGPGGGVCQVTTTLYGAVLLSKLEILERTHHSMPLGYVEPGQDATIAEDYIDLKFRNSKDYPISLSADVAGNTLQIRVLGRKEINDDYFIKLKSEIVEEYVPDEEEIIIDNNIPDGEKITVREAKKGLRVFVYRETYNKSRELVDRERISEDFYRPIKGQYKVNQNFIKIERKS